MLVVKLCLTLCDPMNYSPPGSSVRRILQARILEWVAISFSRGSSWPRNWTQFSYIAGRFFNIWATREAQLTLGLLIIITIDCVNFQPHWLSERADSTFPPSGCSEPAKSGCSGQWAGKSYTEQVSTSHCLLCILPVSLISDKICTHSWHGSL